MQSIFQAPTCSFYINSGKTARTLRLPLFSWSKSCLQRENSHPTGFFKLKSTCCAQGKTSLKSGVKQGKTSDLVRSLAHLPLGLVSVGHPRKSGLPVVDGVFGEADDVVKFDALAGGIEKEAAEGAEHLVGLIVDEEQFGAGGAVVVGGESRGETAVAGVELPGLHEVRLVGDGHAVELEGLVAVVDDVLGAARLGGVAESAAEIEPEGAAVEAVAEAGPEPFVGEGPYAASPVHQSEGGERVEGAGLAVETERDLGLEEVDLVVEVELVRLVEGGVDGDSVGNGRGEGDFGLKAVGFGEEAALEVVGLEAEEDAVAVDGEGGIGLGAGGHVQAAEGQGDDDVFGVEVFPGGMVEEHDVGVAGVGGVADGQLEAELVIGDLVEIPLFEAPGGGVDAGGVEDAAAVEGEAGDGTAVRVEDVFAGLKVVSGMGHVCLRRCGERGLIINEWGGCGRAARFWRAARSWRKSVCGYILKEGRVKRNDKEAMRGEFK